PRRHQAAGLAPVVASSSPLLEWDDALALGNEDIDRQHKRLVEIINQLHSSLDSPDKDAEVMKCLTAMYLHAKEHFFDEEAFMERVSYPDREHHAALHRDFVDKTNSLTDTCLLDAVPCEELLDFLVSWFREHVSNEDAKLIAYTQDPDAR
ncbi:MAG: hemerythrin family protein, partial [Humidesulfovibrio sp.]|nr:hemerythrin family protein [Humidesulfovibrio sp.]